MRCSSVQKAGLRRRCATGRARRRRRAPRSAVDAGQRKRSRVTRRRARRCRRSARARPSVPRALRPRARIADLAADQQSRQPVGDVAARRARRSARACARRTGRARDRPRRGRARRRARTRSGDAPAPRSRQAAEDAVIEQHAYISPVMHVAKSTTRAALDARPFAVRARQHREHALVRGDRAEELRLLAAHHVGNAVRDRA